MTTVLLCLPGSALPKQNWFDKIWLDKWIHLGLFAVMVVLWCRAITGPENKNINNFLQITFYVFLYGVVMEFVQKNFIPNRSFDMGDIVSDLIGSTVGLFIVMRLYKKNRPL
jgi:VanZ family protein